jgi:phosphoribosylanthranilate isomerase
MRDADNIKIVSQLPINILGFIFYPKSPRYVGSDFPKINLSTIPPSVKKAGVFVNEELSDVDSIQKKYALDYIQLHGNENPEYCRDLRKNSSAKIIKAFRISEDTNFEIMKQFEPYCDIFLFDTYTSSYGGSGEQFSWSVLESYNLETPFFLSGGITSDDAIRILSYEHPQLFGIDINSKFEIEPGYKDEQTVSEFIHKIRNTN